MLREATKFIVVHSSATKTTMDIGAGEIRRWHVEGNGWSDIGYHFVIRRDGSLEKGRLPDVVGAHVRGYNHESIGICLVGGLSGRGRADCNFTQSQFAQLELLLNRLTTQYPDAAVCGHRDFVGAGKACPCFDVAAWWSE